MSVYVKQISELPIAEEVNGSEKIIINDNGETKQLPVNKVTPQNIKKEQLSEELLNYLATKEDAWPSDLPMPSDGGFGWTDYVDFYETTDLHFEQDYEAPFFSYDADIHGRLVITELESPYFEVELDGEVYHLELKHAPNGWVSYLGEANDYGWPLFDNYPFCILFYSDGNAQLYSSGEDYHHLKLRTAVIHKINSKYIDAGADPVLENAKATDGIGWTVSSRGTLFTDLQGEVRDTGDNYYAELNTDIDIDFSEIEQKYEDGAKLFVTVNDVTYSDVELYADERYNEIWFGFAYGENNIGKIYQLKGTGDWFYNSYDVLVVPLGNATFSMTWENDEVHKIDGKYFPEGSVGYTSFDKPFYSETVTPFTPDNLPFEASIVDLNNIEWPEELFSVCKISIDGTEYIVPVADYGLDFYYFGELDKETGLPKFDKYPFFIVAGDAIYTKSNSEYNLQLYAGTVHKIDPMYYDDGVKVINKDGEMTDYDLSHLQSGMYLLERGLDVHIINEYTSEETTEWIDDGSYLLIKEYPHDWGFVSVISYGYTWELEWYDDGSENRIWNYVFKPLIVENEEQMFDMISFVVDEKLPDDIIAEGAQVGQIAMISEVDENGKPTAWQAVDMPSGGDEPDLEFVINKHFDDELLKTDVSIAIGTITDFVQKMENGNAKCVIKYYNVGEAGYSVTYGEITNVMVERYDTSVIFSYSYTLSGGSICAVKIDCRTDGTIFDVYKQQGSLNPL